MKRLLLLIVVAMITQAAVISQPCLPGGITFNTQADIDNFQTLHPNCTEIGGDLVVDGEAIDNLNGLSVITLIEGTLEIAGCDILSSLTGLNNVTTIEGDLNIVGNDALFSLLGLEGVTTIEGDLAVWSNLHLVHFTGLNNLNTIGGALWVYLNANLLNFTGLDKLSSLDDGINIGIYGFPSGTWGNQSLNSLTGLNNVTDISGDLKILGNHLLNSLSGIDNINPASIADLTIAFNSSLSTCEVISICDYLVSPNGSVSISNNASGCGSQAEVEYACGLTGIPDINSGSEFSIYPNPAEKILFVSSKNGISINEVSIYNQMGQKVLHENQITDELDVSTLQQGLYVMVLVSDKLNIRKKLVIR